MPNHVRSCSVQLYLVFGDLIWTNSDGQAEPLFNLALSDRSFDVDSVLVDMSCNPKLCFECIDEPTHTKQ